MNKNSIIINIREGEEFIRLGQALKKAGVVQSGVEAKQMIEDGEVRVNSETEVRRGRKLRPGDIVEYGDVKMEFCYDNTFS